MASIPPSQCQAHKIMASMRHQNQQHHSPGVSASDSSLTPPGSPRRTGSDSHWGSWFSLDNMKKYMPVKILYSLSNGNQQPLKIPQEGDTIASNSTLVTQDNKNNNQ
ncbi:uncharacterized protein LOC106158757 [Lingula anatina]|uniref:Uncharacterized protein LOC106158757 n=1 Tax=Lingula anatina TaxID=7574 RepID=A0A1S3HW89_LINAN|nr:uncharacterized protein LOC106158757 [Lingula anatina]XP_013390297.1 uncharacterized protein LOC106158757 [Lingula anatina]XP_013390299.1 uncharacterized protein LOC106158757 [Lingula anatina]XP_013390300.1 uncharacterized protein LOC106158757 [Lingula anatina]|eukprot:XP_013390296.1 uncharacterized protein LOC106158757 [Lingula anatina]